MTPWAYSSAPWSLFVIENYSSAVQNFNFLANSNTAGSIHGLTGVDWVGGQWRALPSPPPLPPSFSSLISWSRKERATSLWTPYPLFSPLLGLEAERKDGEMKRGRTGALETSSFLLLYELPVASTYVAATA